MEVSNDKVKFTTENSRDNTTLQTEYLTYHKKLKNEIEAIPKEHKKFFRNALNRHTFDMEVYIPQLSEKNRKYHPNKNYLINKLIKYERLVNLNKDLLEKKSKELTKFNQDYSIIRENNAKQKDYVNNLLKLYKSKGYEVNNLKYSKKDNIYNKSILLDHMLGENTTQDVLRYGKDKENRKNFINDNLLLVKFNDVIQEAKSPNAKNKNKKNYNKFNNSINDFIKGIQINKSSHSLAKIDENKIRMKIKKRKKKLKTKRQNKTYQSLDQNIISSTKEDQNNNSNDENIKNVDDSNNVNNELNKNNSSGNLEEDNLNASMKSNKIDKTITTYYGNDSLIFNESKNIEENENNTNTNKMNVRFSSFKDNNKNGQKDITNTSYNNNNNKNGSNSNLIEYNKNANTKKNKYLLTSLNKIKLLKKENKEKKVNINTTNNNIYIFTKSNVFDNSQIKNKFKSRDNLKINLINLPEINPTSTTYRKNIIKDKNQKNNNNSGNIGNKNSNNIQIKIKNLKETFSKKYSKAEFEKEKQKEINNLYSTITFNPRFFKDYPVEKVEKYFYNFKNIRLSKLNTNKGSNVYPLLEGLENIVKEKELYKLAKSLNDTKKDIYLRSTGTLDNFDKLNVFDPERIKEYDDKIPLLKYDYAENILRNHEKLGNKKSI